MQSLLTYVFVLFWTVLASGQTVHTVYDFTINVVEMRESHGFDRGMDKSDTLAVYGWSADGARLWVRDGSGDGLDYLGSLTLSTEDGETRLETAAVVGGVIRVGKDGRQTAECHVTDHLGSVRVVMDGAGDALERNDYYPFGARYGEEGWPESANRFKFNGKEEQETGDLGFLDYGARMYDPAVGRWWSVDPAAGEFCSLSVYSYCGNSPLVNMDPDGSWFTRYVDKDYNTLFQTDDGSEDIVMVPGGYIQDFERYAAMYASSAGMRSLFDSQGWNSHWRQEFGLAPRQLTEGQLAVLELFNSEWAKDKAVRNMLNPSGGNMVSMAFAEALSQWTNPELVIGGLSVGLGGLSAVNTSVTTAMAQTTGTRSSWLNWLKNGGKTFAQYKKAHGGTKTLDMVVTSTGEQRISMEFHHLFITRRMQKRYGLPNWMVNNRLNVVRLNTIQHALIDSYRFRFLKKGIKSEVGWFNKYNWFYKF